MANPVVLRAAVVLFCAGFAFLLGLICIRLLRKSISDEADISSDSAPPSDALPMHVYNTVIQQLKQQKHELQVQSQAEQQRARTTETLSQAVLSNLSSGVLVFGMNGLVKTSNPAAKEILGFASTTGMCAEDIFRGAVLSNPAASGVFPDGTGVVVAAGLGEGAVARNADLFGSPESAVGIEGVVAGVAVVVVVLVDWSRESRKPSR